MSANPENKEPIKEQKPEVKTEIPSNENRHGLYEYAKTNTRDVIAYILLVIGIILLFFGRFSGELLIGIVFGLYFATEIQSLFRNLNAFIEDQGIVRSIVLGVTLLALFISTPGIFIGAILAVIVKYLFAPDKG